jgi:DNA polymerase III alpha subunit
MNKTCLITSHYTIGQSILNLDDTLEIKDNYPVSAIAIAKKHNLELNLVENNFSGFIEAYKNCKKHDISLRFGLKIVVCDNLNTKDNESLLTESSIVIWLLNSFAYRDALNIYNEAATTGFYYVPRTDWKTLKTKMTENLAISLPFYSSFLARNTLNYNHRAIPDFGDIKPVFHVENHDIPFDPILEKKAVDFGGKIQKTHTCYYYKEADILQFMVFRAISERSSFQKPQLRAFSSNKFAVETYLNNV